MSTNLYTTVLPGQEDTPNRGVRRLAILEIFQQAKGWLSVQEITRILADQGIMGHESGNSARVRDLRKPQYGGYIIDTRMSKVTGLAEYRLSPNQEPVVKDRVME